MVQLIPVTSVEMESRISTVTQDFNTMNSLYLTFLYLTPDCANLSEFYWTTGREYQLADHLVVLVQ